MDDLVKAAMAKWPNVPDCKGWLGLDERGDWYMRDDRVQAEGEFPQSKGARIEHEALKAFIHRNYDTDSMGQWFFQNGPQRVFVELANAPWVWRIDPANGLVASTGQPAGQLLATVLDETGRLYVHATRGLGLVHSQDIWLASEHLNQGDWPAPQHLKWDSLPHHFGFVRSPKNKKAARSN